MILYCSVENFKIEESKEVDFKYELNFPWSWNYLCEEPKYQKRWKGFPEKNVVGKF